MQKKPFVLAAVFSVLTYLVFFYPLLNSKLTLYSGSDSSNLHYPKRSYLYESLKSGRFPFWTERVFSGFPIYADVESGYLHPLNLIFTYIFGPITSYKLLHFGFYLLGSLSFYFFLRKKHFNLGGFFVANLIYFFSFFHLYHQQHFNMVWATYLFPTILLLGELFLASGKTRFIFLQALVFANIFYFGALQMCLLLFVALVFYVFLWIKREHMFKYLAVFGAFFLIMILPLLLPAITLYRGSVRQETVTSFSEGSFAPMMAVNVFYPFIFDYGEGYKGVSVNPEYLKHELYIYVGISTVILGVLGFLIMRKDEFSTFLRGCCLAFLVLGFVGYFPFVRSLPLLPFSLFRYWGRSVVLFVFAAACYTGFFISNFSVPKFKKTCLISLLIPVILLFLFQMLNFKDVTTLETLRFLKHRFTFDSLSVVWFVLFLTALFFVAAFFKFRFNYLKYLGILLVFTDIFFFGRLVLNQSFYPKFWFAPEYPISQVFNNKRIITFDYRAYTNKGLYFKSWGPFGYSQFVPKNYAQLLDALGFKNAKSIERKEGFTLFGFVSGFKYLGTYALYTPGSLPQVFNPDFPFKTLSEVKLFDVILQEGYITARLQATSGVTIQTFVRNYPGWKLTMDGVPADFSAASGVFLEFNLPPGEHSIELVFEPWDFWLGVYCSLALLAGVGLVSLYMPKISFPKTFTEKSAFPS